MSLFRCSPNRQQLSYDNPEVGRRYQDREEAPNAMHMAAYFGPLQRMIWSGLKGGLKIVSHASHLNFFGEFKGLVRSRTFIGLWISDNYLKSIYLFLLILTQDYLF